MPEIAESLESRGLYRRAANRWREVMNQTYNEKEREQYRRRMNKCLDMIKRPPIKYESLNDVKKSINAARERMGLAQPKNQPLSIKSQR